MSLTSLNQFIIKQLAYIEHDQESTFDYVFLQKQLNFLEKLI